MDLPGDEGRVGIREDLHNRATSSGSPSQPVGIFAGGILANGQKIAFLVALASLVAASANLPTIVYSLFWKRFNTAGALWSIYRQNS